MADLRAAAGALLERLDHRTLSAGEREAWARLRDAVDATEAILSLRVLHVGDEVELLASSGGARPAGGLTVPRGFVRALGYPEEVGQAFSVDVIGHVHTVELTCPSGDSCPAYDVDLEDGHPTEHRRTWDALQTEEGRLVGSSCPACGARGEGD